ASAGLGPTLRYQNGPTSGRREPGQRCGSTTGSATLRLPHKRRCGDVLADYARRDVSGMRVPRKRVGWTRQAVTVLLVVTAVWVLLLLHTPYRRTTALEPVSCP